MSTVQHRLVMLVFLGAGGIGAQTTPVFDVSSVKVNMQPPGQSRGEGPGCANGRFVAINRALQPTVMWAFRLTQRYQLVGMPPGYPYFDIVAKAESPVSEDQCRLMVRRLLADRFKLAFHMETRDFPVYELTVGKNGPTMKKAAESDTEPGVNITINGNRAPGFPGAAPQGLTMAQLVQRLDRTVLDYPIVDKTGLEGLYKITLDFAWLGPGAIPGPGDSQDLLIAVQQQLGLKLEVRKEPFETLVIDHLEQPDAN